MSIYAYRLLIPEKGIEKRQKVGEKDLNIK